MGACPKDCSSAAPSLGILAPIQTLALAGTPTIELSSFAFLLIYSPCCYLGVTCSEKITMDAQTESSSVTPLASSLPALAEFQSDVKNVSADQRTTRG